MTITSTARSPCFCARVSAEPGGLHARASLPRRTSLCGQQAIGEEEVGPGGPGKGVHHSTSELIATGGLRTRFSNSDQMFLMGIFWSPLALPGITSLTLWRTQRDLTNADVNHHDSWTEGKFILVLPIFFLKIHLEIKRVNLTPKSIFQALSSSSPLYGQLYVGSYP